jgi:hypothetical protein
MLSAIATAIVAIALLDCVWGNFVDDLILASRNLSIEQLPSEQCGGTCYAHAAAWAIASLDERVYGRNGPSYMTLTKNIIDKHGCHGAKTRDVLLEYEGAPHYANISDIPSSSDQYIQSALEGNPIPRPVVMSFRLSCGEWTQFSDFFRNSPCATLTYSVIANWSPSGNVKGHAVNIVSSEDGAWVIRNSWGKSWACGGHFRLERNQDVYHRLHSKFTSVGWLPSRLPQVEMDAWRQLNISQQEEWIYKIKERQSNVPKAAIEIQEPVSWAWTRMVENAKKIPAQILCSQGV